jgi:hypothetical protein
MPKKNTLITGRAVTQAIPSPAGGVKLETFIPWTLVKRGVKKQVITPLDAPEQFREEAAKERQEREAAKDSPLIRALGLAHYWQSLLESGMVNSPAEIAQQESIDVTRVREILRLSLLSPELVEMILQGRPPRGLTLEYLLRNPLPRNWEDQRDKIAVVDRSAAKT